MAPRPERGREGPDRERALALYRTAVRGYDRLSAPAFGRYRRRAVERLELAPGEAVLDVACGTGLNLPLLLDRVGARGRVVGVDLSPDMLAVARDRAGAAGVTLIEAPIEEAELPGPFDAALFSLTHDVLQSPAALARVVAALRPDARVAAFGVRWAPRWNVPLNAAVRRLTPRYVTTREGLDRPWRRLAELVPDLRVEPLALGAAYVAWGRARHGPRARGASPAGR